MNKSLTEKAIDIKGKQYVLVSDRIIYFNETYTNGSIQTQLISSESADIVVIKAKVTPDTKNPDRYFTGYSQAKWGDGYINKTSAMENCETSAVGRALAMMGIGVIDSIASVDEIKKAESDSRNDDSYGAEDNVICPVHNIKMIHYLDESRDKDFWYHKLENGEYCNGRDTKYNREK